MRQTFQLLQLLIIIAAGYAYFNFQEEARLYYILGGMVVTYILEKMDTLVLDKQKLQRLMDEQQVEAASKEKSTSPLNTLMESKNPKQLSKAIGKILKKLRIVVAAPMGKHGIDLEFWASGSDQVFGLKVLSSVEELEEELSDYNGLMAFNNAPDNKHRVVIVASNAIAKGGIDGKVEQTDFSSKSEGFLKEHHLLAMTTTTLRRIHLVCSKKGIDPKLFLRLFEKHAGGVFRLEDYAKR